MKDSPLLDDYFTEEELCRQLKKGLRTIRQWRKEGVGPPITRVGRVVLFHKESTRAWLKSCERPMPRQDKRRRTSPGD
jgi:hypothetical protein